MRYAIAMEPGSAATAWGVVVPDLPGCFSAGDTVEKALIQAEETVTARIEATLDAGQAIPTPSSIETLRADHAQPRQRQPMWSAATLRRPALPPSAA